MTLEADAALIAVGTWVRSKTIVDPYGDPVAGIVCGIAYFVETNFDTGEIVDVVTYRVRDCNDREPLRTRHLPGSDVDPAECWPASTYDIARLARRICFEIGKAKSRSARVARELRPAETAALADALAVLAAVA